MNTAGQRQSSNGRGVLLLIASILLATLESVILRLLSDQASMGQLLLARSTLQILLTFWLARLLTGRSWELLRTERLGSHLLRSGLSAVAWLCYYTSFQLLPMGLATTLTFSSQFFVLMMVGPVLGERVSRSNVLATSIGFVGVVVAAGVWQPQEVDWRVIFGFIASMVGAVMVVMTRSLTRTEPTDTIMIYMPMVVFFTALPQAWLDWRPLTLSSGALLLVFGLMGSLAGWAHVQAYRYARPSLLAPVTYLRLGTGLAAGAWIFQDPITPSMIVGVLLILLGAFYPQRH